MSFAARQAINWTEQGLVPDSIIRSAIRRLLRARLAELRPDDVEHVAQVTARFAESMNGAPVALLPQKANEQHYEVPPEFFGARARRAPQVQLLLLESGSRASRRCRIASTRDHL